MLLVDMKFLLGFAPTHDLLFTLFYSFQPLKLNSNKKNLVEMKEHVDRDRNAFFLQTDGMQDQQSDGLSDSRVNELIE